MYDLMLTFLEHTAQKKNLINLNTAVLIFLKGGFQFEEPGHISMLE